MFNSLPWSWEGSITVDIDLWHFFLDRVALNRWSQSSSESEMTPESEGIEIFRHRVRQQWYDNPPSAES